MNAKLFIILCAILVGSLNSTSWWNGSWNYVMPIDINSTVSTNLTNFTSRISLNTSNTTLWNTTTCTNVRFVESTNITSLGYDLDSNSPVFCGNSTNNATFWVTANLTGNSLTRIFAYLGNVNAATGENKTKTWGASGSDYVSVWHMNDGLDVLELNNLTVNAGGTVTYNTIVNPTICKVGFCANLSQNSYIYTAIGAHPTTTQPGYMSIWSYRNTWTSNLYSNTIMSYGGNTYGHLRSIGSNGINSSTFRYTDENSGSPEIVNVMGHNLYLEFYAGNSNDTTNNYVFINNTSSYLNTYPFGSVPAGSVYIGTESELPDSRQWFKSSENGTVDEARLAVVAHSTDWEAAEYGQFSIASTEHTQQGNFTVNCTNGGAVTGNNSTFIPPANLSINATASANYYFLSWNITAGNGIINNASNASTFVTVNDLSQTNAQATFIATSSLTQPTILPASPSVISLINCTNGTFSNVEVSENTSNRSWAWFKNGVSLNITSQYFVVSSYNISKEDNLSCTETTSGNNFTQYQTSNSSINVTVINSLPVTATPTSIVVSSTNMSINCTTTDSDGGSDIANASGISTSGSVAQLANGTSGTLFWASWNVTGLFSAETFNFTCNATDLSGAYSSNETNFTTTDGDMYGTETQVGYALNNLSVLWNQTYTTTGVAHTCIYSVIKPDFYNLSTYSVADNTNTIVASFANATAINWTCSGALSPYSLNFSTSPILVNYIDVAGSPLGNNAKRYTIKPNSTLNINMNFTFVYAESSSNRRLWHCIYNNDTACDAGDIGVWLSQSFSEIDTTTQINGSKVIIVAYPNVFYATTNDAGIVPPGPSGGGGGGLPLLPQNTTVVGLGAGAFEIFNQIGKALGDLYLTAKEKSPFGVAWYWLFIAATSILSGIKLKSKKLDDQVVGSAFFVITALLVIIFIGLG